MTVNVFRQKLVGDVKVPVAVYIHGGAFNRGSGTCAPSPQTSEAY